MVAEAFQPEPGSPPEGPRRLVGEGVEYEALGSVVLSCALLAKGWYTFTLKGGKASSRC